MSAPYLGGCQITNAQWISARALRVQFSTTYGSTYQYQLYAGRSLAGQTERETERVIVANVIPSEYPQHLQLVAVDPAQRLTDYGSRLPPRPYNRLKLAFTLPSYAAADAKKYEITSGTEPGGAVDSANVIYLQPFDLDGAHEFLTEPLPGSGVWNFAIAGRDDTLPSGNKGTVLAISGTVVAHPPDVARSGRSRFSLSTAGGVVTASYSF